MKEKKLLIVERCNNNLNIIEEQLEGHEEKSIVLSGVFTTFDQKNRNGRIYESADFLPHVEALKESIKHKALLGEMDHPHSFETSLANASHVIESLEFDPAQNAIIGKIRLLNTARGKDAQALVKDGIPLHISSRAAGTVNESGKVRLQQLFTYDLVAEPGFANAVLTQVNEGVNHESISDKSKNILIALNESLKPNINESLGINDEDGIEIYEVSEDASNTNLTPKVAQEGQKTVDFGNEQAEKTVKTVASTGTRADQNGFAEPEPVPTVDTKNTKNMDNGQYILYSDFQKYSEHLSEIITDLQNAIANYKAELTNIKDNSKPTQSFDASNVDNTMISDLIAQQVAAAVEKLPIAPAVPAEGAPAEPTAKPCDGEDCDDKKATMEEKYDNLVSYVKYLSEQLDKSITHQDYIAEEANKMIAHQDYLAENMNKMIEHQDYLAENINDTIGYQNYVAEMLDKSIDYSNMLAEEQNKTIAYNNYLSEKMNQMVDHQDYLAENMGKIADYQDYLAENINKSEKNAVVEENAVEEGDGNADNTVSETVETPKKEAFNSKEYQNALSEKLASLITTVKEQYAETKRLEAEAITESKKACADEKNFNLINFMPARLNERWSKLSDTRKQEILAESKMFVINNASSAEYFWNTRDMREKQIAVEKVEEEKTAQPAQPLNEDVMQNDRYKAMMEQIKSRMRKY